jgi:3-dehydroquinate synthase/shikimate kinase/3-dehydroquinate synthase
MKKKEHGSIFNHITNLKLPSNINKFFSAKDLNKILSFMLKDKKNYSEKINLVLLKKIGSPVIDKEFNKKSLAIFLKSELIN